MTTLQLEEIKSEIISSNEIMQNKIIVIHSIIPGQPALQLIVPLKHII